MTEQLKSSKTTNIILWIAQILLSAFFIMGAVMKFMPIEKISVMMPWTGQVPAIAVRLLGMIDLSGAAGLILPGLLQIKPKLTGWAAVGIILMMICAIIFHVSRGEGEVIGVNIFAMVLAGFVVWGRGASPLVNTK
ncbi:DoxX family protein [Dyadobacter subterraneus]|uniref:DoxX family protein n=1 Tax=Dyadobacter subterraneus TaxID=2773304 RepID=A0ABR9WAX0_9BACT|nr:DoxX family protein [Dyadobacter subterraneus]MBE9462629.1 DoxX family protein [Dyadobacter subterraneus]